MFINRMGNKKNKKSQMEIMGLAIIVILLFLGMVFVIRFVVLKKPAEYKKEYTQTELASNIIGAILYTNAQDCSMVTFAKLFQDCAENSPDGIIDCGPKSISGRYYSCDYAKNKITDILKNTLGGNGLKLKYDFKVITENPPIDVIKVPSGTGTSCSEEKKHKQYPLPGSKTIYVTLDICD